MSVTNRKLSEERNVIMRIFSRKKDEVFKLQRPLHTNGDYNEILIYNEDRSVEAQLPVSSEVIELIFNDEYKVYMLGKVGDDGIVRISGRVEDQDW